MSCSTKMIESFPVQNTKDIADEEDTGDTNRTYDLNTCQETDSDLTILGWDSQALPDEELPFMRLPGSERIAPKFVARAMSQSVLSAPPVTCSEQQQEKEPGPTEESSSEHSNEMLTNTLNENAESNAKVPQESDTETTTLEATSSRSSQLLPDFLPSSFGQNQNMETTERSPTPPPLFTECESTSALPVEEEARGSNPS